MTTTPETRLQELERVADAARTVNDSWNALGDVGAVMFAGLHESLAALDGYTDETPTTNQRLEAAGKILAERDAEIGRLKSARDALAEQHHRINAAVDAAGGSQFEATQHFIKRQAADLTRLRTIEAAAKDLHKSAIQVVNDGGIYYRVPPYLLINLSKAIWPPAALTQKGGA